MRCDACGAYVKLSESFCRVCGARQRSSRLPVRRDVQLPVLWQVAVPPIARGAALVAAGVVAEWVLRSVARSVIGSPTGKRAASSKSKALAKRRKGTLPEEIVAISETIVTRKVIFRR